MPPVKKKKNVVKSSVGVKEKKSSKISVSTSASRKSLEKRDASKVQAGDDKELTQVEREMLNIQIKDLQVKLQRREDLLEELQKVVKEYQTQYEKEVKDKGDIVEFLKRALQERAVEVTELQDKLLGLQQSLQKEKERTEQQFSKLQADFTDQKEKLTEKNMLLGGKLSALEEFRMQKDDLTAKLADMQEQLETQVKQHKEEVSQLLKKMVTDKERMKDEVEKKVEEVAANFRKTSDEQMGLTIKRTITENITLNQQIKSSSEKIVALTTNNQRLSRLVANLDRQQEIQRNTEKELARKVQSQQKAMKTMSERHQEQHEKLMRDKGFLESEEYFKARTNELEKQLQRTEEELSKAQLENEELYLKLEKTNKQLGGQRNLNRKLCDAIIKSADSIRIGLTPSKEGKEFEVFHKRGAMLQQLLQLLVQAEEVSAQTNYNIRNVNRTASLSTIS